MPWTANCTSPTNPKKGVCPDRLPLAGRAHLCLAGPVPPARQRLREDRRFRRSLALDCHAALACPATCMIDSTGSQIKHQPVFGRSWLPVQFAPLSAQSVPNQKISRRGIISTDAAAVSPIRDLPRPDWLRREASSLQMQQLSAPNPTAGDVLALWRGIISTDAAAVSAVSPEWHYS